MLEWLYNVVMSFLTWFFSLLGVPFNKSSGGGQEEVKHEESQYSDSSAELSPPNHPNPSQVSLP